MKQTVTKDIGNEELSLYKTLRDNVHNNEGSFIADSPKVVNLLLESGVACKSILATQEYYEKHQELLESKDIEKLYIASKDLMQSIVGHKIHHNCMMHGVRPKPHTLEEMGEGVVMLDGITSSENIGSIARSMAAFGVDSYLVPSSSPHPYSRRALRVSMGYVSHLKYHIYDDIFETMISLKKLGYRVFAAEVDKDASFLANVKVPQKWVLIMGHEGKGITQEILDICDEIISIEMQEGVKSFNVAVAASIIMYKLSIL